LSEKRKQGKCSLKNVHKRYHYSPYKGVKKVQETWEGLKYLYEASNTNQVLFLKSNILSMQMEENEILVTFF